jgi:hypothetical protein
LYVVLVKTSGARDPNIGVFSRVLCPPTVLFVFGVVALLLEDEGLLEEFELVPATGTGPLVVVLLLGKEGVVSSLSPITRDVAFLGPVCSSNGVTGELMFSCLGAATTVRGVVAFCCTAARCLPTCSSTSLLSYSNQQNRDLPFQSASR